MKLNPQQAPLYGLCVLTVQLDVEDAGPAANEEEAEFYLLFSGSTQRHVSSTKRVSNITLQAVCPAHNVCEQVLVTLCLSRPGAPVDTPSQETFCYVQDLALDMAHYLLDNTAPEEALLLDDPLECERLDESLALALKHLSLPPPQDCRTHSITHREDWTSRAETQSQQLSSLLQLAASRGLRTVGSFLLQQPGAREALRTTNAWGQTPARVAQNKGHEQLVALFTEFETSDVHVEPKELHSIHDGRVFEHHANLGTYTLTLPSRRENLDRAEGCCILEEVEELRRLIQLHRNTQESQQNAGPAVQTTKIFDTAAEDRRAPHTLEPRTHSPCASSTTSFKTGERKRSVLPGKSPAGRKKRNKKRPVKATRHSTESTGNKTSSFGSAAGSGLEARGSISPSEPVAAAEISDGGAVKISGTETPLPIKPVCAPGGYGKHASRKLARSLTTNIREKQEGENWEVDVPRHEQAAETEANHGDGQKRPARRDPLTSTGEAAEHETVTMGQEQSRDPQESESDPEEPSKPHSTNKSPQSGRRSSPRSPDTDKNERRGLWWDSSRVGSQTGPPTQRSVRYQGENGNQGAGEDSKKKAVSSQSIWYDADTINETELEQLEQAECKLSSLQESDPRPPQLLEQAPSSSQLHSSLNQLHVPGAQPAPSHGPATQRQEVQGLQREEEIGPHLKEGGAKEASEEVRSTQTTVDIEERGEEKPEAEEKGAKGRKKRRKKGRRGGTEAKLSSSSSLEYQSQSETNTNLHSEAPPEAKDRKYAPSPTVIEPSWREEADKEAMHLPSQTESQTRDTCGPDCLAATSESTFTELSEVTASHTLETMELFENVNCHKPEDCNRDSVVAASELTNMENTNVDITTEQPIGKELLESVELEKALDDTDSGALAEHGSVTVAGVLLDKKELVDNKFPEQLPVPISGPTDVTDELFPMIFSKTTSDSVQPEASAKGIGLSTEAAGLPCEGATDVSRLQIQEGSTETTAREYLVHCLVSDMLRDQQHKEEERRELWVGKEEGGEDTSGERTSEVGEVAPGEGPSSMRCGKELKFSLSCEEKVQKYDEDLAITALAIVTVAVASAMARIELNQQLADASAPAESTGQSSCEGRAHVKKSETEEMQLEAQAESSRSAPDHKEELNTGTKQDESKPLQADVKPLPKSRSMIPAEVDRHCHVLRQIQLPSPVVDTGQQSNCECEHSAKEQPVCSGESSEQPLAPHLEKEEMHDNNDGGDGGGQAHQQSNCESEDSAKEQPVCPGENSEQPLAPRLEKEETHDNDDGADGGGQAHQQSNCECEHSAKEQPVCPGENGEQPLAPRLVKEETHNNDGGGNGVEQAHQPDSPESSAEPPEGKCEWVPSSPTLPITPSYSNPGELSAPVNVELGEFQSSQLPVETRHVAVTFHNTYNKCVAVHEEDGASEKKSDSLDTVDGWKDRERKKPNLDEEERKDMITGEDTSHAETQTSVTAADEGPKESKPDSSSPHSQQIQRGRDICLPVQSCPQSTVTSCTAPDVHPIQGEHVSVCGLLRDNDNVEVGVDLDGSILEKPSSGHKDTNVQTSNEARVQETVFPSDGATTAGTAESPQSSRLSWKSKTEDRGGGGEEEEKKDQLLESPISSAILRASIRSLSPFRRHSWEPGRSGFATENDISQRSSLKSLSGEAKRAKPPLHRRSMSWCQPSLRHPDQETIDSRSYSLERLEVQRGGHKTQLSSLSAQEERSSGRTLFQDSQERGSLISLTEEEQEGDSLSIDSQTSSQALSVTGGCPTMFHHQSLTKSISMVTISHRDLDARGFTRSKRRISFSLSISPLLSKNRRFFSIGSFSSEDEDEEEGGRISSFSSNASSLEYSISEEEPGPLRSETEGKGGPKISRTFSYLRSKMTKKGKEKERRGVREQEIKDREKKNANIHVFIPVSASPSAACQHCTKLLHNKEAFHCSNCGVYVHKSCRESVSTCTKSKTKQQTLCPEAVPGSAVSMRSKSTSSASSGSSTSPSSSRERWSAVTSPDDQLSVPFPWKPPSNLKAHTNLAKSISTSNIAGLDDVPLKGLKFLSQSTDNLHQGSKVNASTESLTDEGTEMMDSQLMGEFECEIKDLEADSWSGTMDKKFLKTLKKDEIKRQDVIYELYQTEFHHVRTLKIMSEVYYKGLQREVQLDAKTLDKIFPVLDDLLDAHTHFLNQLLETKRMSQAEGKNNSFLICHIGDILVNQFTDCSAERLKKVYGKFCSRHNEAVNLYKDLHAKDKRFQAFIKRMMSSSIVRRLSIPECVLLVTQRITKYPVLIQRILQHTKESDEDHSLICKALRCVKELITAVDSKVNEHEKKRRLMEVYSRTDSKSIMRMKSGQMFAKEDLIRGRKLLHDGALLLKNSAGRLKDVHALLLSDVLVFLQEKDQKFVFASLDQRSTVISLQNLIVREVANEDRGLFLITAGTEKPEMVEVLASSKDERNTWRAIIQDTMHCMEKDEDEGVPSETEEDRRQQESRAKEIRELLRRKDEEIVSLLEEKVHIFRELNDCNALPEDGTAPARERMLFRATPDDVTKGEPIINDALREVETLHTLVNSGIGATGCSAAAALTGGSVGLVCLPRRAETFGGFDSHQMTSSKSGEKEEGEESLDLRRTESDSVLKKGATASLQMLLKRNNEQVQHSVTHLHDLLISLQAVVVQQDSFIEDQRQALNDRLTANSSRHSSSSSISSLSSSRPSSLIEQEKHRSLERQRQEAASLQKQQAAHQEEKKRKEREWEVKERGLGEREERLRAGEDETKRRQLELLEERETLQRRKEEFQKEVERLREAQRRLERDKETLRRDTDRLEGLRRNESEQLQRYQRTPSTTSEDSVKFPSCGSLDLDSKEAAEPSKEVELSSSAPTKEPFLRIGSKRMSKNFNPFSSSSSSKSQGAEKESQLPSRLLQLAKPKEKKDKKKKKGKGGDTEAKSTVMLDPQNDGDIYYC